MAYVHRTINDSKTATASISTTTLTVVATDVNRLTANFDVNYWTVDHDVEVDIVNDVVSSKKATSKISVTVVPCAITTSTIAPQTITVGDRKTY